MTDRARRAKCRRSSNSIGEVFKAYTERIIREEVFGDAAEAEGRNEAPPKQPPALGFSLEGEG
jgi:hypothetical protein